MASTTFLNQSPHPDTLSKGPVQGGPYQLYPPNADGSSIWLNLPFVGVPDATNGVGWASKGSSGVDTLTGIWYSNIGTADAPNWQKFGAQ